MHGALGHRAIRGLAAAVVALSLGCATAPLRAPATRYTWFAAPSASDAWTPKIAGWQSRERSAPDLDARGAPASVSGGAVRPAAQPAGDDLREKYLSFRRDRKRAMANEVAEWIQREARNHYRPDGPIDHWATLEETLANNGDDCDGLELLVYQFLRDLGFRDDEVFRAIVYRPSDGQHHMVTLWFESADDPWVIDPTGAMTHGMPRMSQVPGWVPLKLFTETAEYTVERQPVAAR